MILTESGITLNLPSGPLWMKATGPLILRRRVVDVGVLEAGLVVAVGLLVADGRDFCRGQHAQSTEISKKGSWADN
jgi:hypothetical protein